MTEEYRVPRPSVSATVAVEGGAPRTVRLYLRDRSETHAGPDRPLDLLNGSRRFLPVEDPDEGFTLLRRASILVLSVPADAERAGEPGDAEDLAARDPEMAGACRREVRVRMEGGTEVQGTVVYVLPEGERRLQDYFNRCPDFVRLWDGDTVRLVNARRILRIRPI